MRKIWIVVSSVLIGLILPLGKAYSNPDEVTKDHQELIDKSVERAKKLSKRDEYIETLKKLDPQILRAIEKHIQETPELGKAKYEVDGHMYATYIISKEAGFTNDQSYKLAYFAQYPDKVSELSATWSAVFDLVLLNLERRRKIMATLHSLHGGDDSEVTKRRNGLAAIVRNGIHGPKGSTLDLWQVGVVIHAFADAYAHTDGKGADEKAFGYGVGHLFHGHKPDLIGYDHEKFREYICHLYKSLSDSDDCDDHLTKIDPAILLMKNDPDSAMSEIEILAKSDYGFRNFRYEFLEQSFFEKVENSAVLELIALVENKITNK